MRSYSNENYSYRGTVDMILCEIRHWNSTKYHSHFFWSWSSDLDQVLELWNKITWSQFLKKEGSLKWQIYWVITFAKQFTFVMIILVNN